jgi:DNA-binding NtrC family response regulator
MPAQAVLLDLHLPDGNGFDLLQDAALVGDAEIVLITGHASVESSVQALRVGAVDYLVKPVQPAQLKRMLGRLGQGSELRAAIRQRTDSVRHGGKFGRLIGDSPAMQRVYQQISRVAPTAVNVFIVGESGTGKELVAQTLHELSVRRRHPLLAINCGAISAQLIESELFGHEKGSFTGASRQHRGYFERAHEGTLFLDEITEMPMDLQVKLLRVLETGVFTRVGSEEPIETDVRIIAATNRDPLLAVRQGRLREDLYYRLDVFEIALPALRERLDDVPALALSFLQELNQRDGVQRQFQPQALAQMSAYAWPGNVRELRNVVQRSALMAEGEWIEAPMLSPGSPSPRSSAPQDAHLSLSDPSGPVHEPVRLPVGTTIAQAERQLILATLEHCGGLREPTADMLGISLKTLYNRLREYGQISA